MKKKICLITALILALSLCACQNENTSPKTSVSAETISSETENKEDTEQSETDIKENTISEENKTEEKPENENPSDEITEDTIRQLFGKNLNCMINIFSISSLPYTDEEAAEGMYVVDSLFFKDYAEFEDYIRSVYCTEEADRLLYNTPYENDPKYVSIDGKLCLNVNHAGAKGYYVDWSEYSIEIDSVENGICEFTLTGSIEEPADIPVKEDYIVYGSAVYENGRWLLTKMLY